MKKNPKCAPLLEPHAFLSCSQADEASASSPLQPPCWETGTVLYNQSDGHKPSLSARTGEQKQLNTTMVSQSSLSTQSCVTIVPHSTSETVTRTSFDGLCIAQPGSGSPGRRLVVLGGSTDRGAEPAALWMKSERKVSATVHHRTTSKARTSYRGRTGECRVRPGPGAASPRSGRPPASSRQRRAHLCTGPPPAGRRVISAMRSACTRFLPGSECHDAKQNMTTSPWHQRGTRLWRRCSRRLHQKALYHCLQPLGLDGG